VSQRPPSEKWPEHRPHLSWPPPQCLAGPTPTKRTEAKAAPLLVLPDIIVAGWAHADQANRGLSSVLNSLARQHSGWKSPRQSSDQRPEQRSQLSCPPPQSLAWPTPSEKKSQRCALKFRARHDSGWLSPHRGSDQRPEKCPHLSYPLAQWVAWPTPTNRTEARVAPSTFEPATTVEQANRGERNALTCRARHHSGWLSPRPSNEHRPEQRPHLSCPPLQ
jgi:hypothetical protein